ncbi:glycosyltransferase [Cereibacter sp. SYSU M97828]|nr:glycosyltransferase [Cereibacter flavus]
MKHQTFDIGQAGRQKRVVLYSHDTLGFGHLRRNMLLAGALKRLDPAPDVLMIAGMQEAGAFTLPPGVDVLTLPAYGKRADGSYHARSLGLDLRDLARLRSDTIKGALTAYDPDLVIVDNVPRGAQSELDRPLAALRKRGRAKIVLGLRDVIDSAETVRAQWLRRRNFAAIRDWFDEVWIYGDPAFFDLSAEYAFGEDFTAKAHSLGYLDQRARLPGPIDVDAGRAPYILCAVGGGRDGAALCEAFSQATLPAGHRGIILTGTQMPPEARARLDARIGARVDMEIVDFLPEPLLLMQGAARIIAMGGYNTVTEALSLRRPTLIVPRVAPRLEQLLRAERLAAKGAVGMIRPDDLTPASLSDWMAGPPPRAELGRAMLDMDGLDRMRARAAHLLNQTITEAVA